MIASKAAARGAAGESPIRVLLAEDEPNLGKVLEQYLTARGLSVTMVRDGRSALEQMRTTVFDVALLDIVMPEVDGLEVLRQVREEALPPEIIVVTGNGTSETAIAARKLGAYDVVSKPYRMADVDALVRRAFEKRLLTRDNQVFQARLRRAAPTTQFLTRYAPLIAIRRLIEQVAPGGLPVLISGESGTGKRLVARMMHHHGAFPDGPFIEADCRSPNEPLSEAMLFGREQSRADAGPPRMLGLLELAEGGTLYLDDVGAIDNATQQALERAMDSGFFVRSGGTRRVPVNARLVASSTQDLSRRAAAGLFRADLLHRMTSVRVTLPALRERLTDIPLLATHFLAQFALAAGPGLTDDALSALERYRWPGNVRELRVVMEHAALLSVDGRVQASDLSLGAEGRAAVRALPEAPLTLDALERQHISEVLGRVRWHQGRAADLLGISPKTLYRKIREFGFRRPAGRSGT